MAQSPFETMTPERLKNDMLARVTADGIDIDTREGSYANVLLSEAAYVMWKYGQTLGGFMSILFPDASSGEYLDLHAAQIGMSRLPGAKASVDVTFAGADGTRVPAGTIVCTGAALRFITEEDAEIFGGTATVRCMAEEIGADYNVTAGSITQMAVNVAGVSGLTNKSAATGGADAESDADLWARYHERRTQTITSGNAGHYVMWAKETAGVSYALCVPLWNGNGTVKVIIGGADRGAVDSAIVSACAAHIEEEKPIGATVTVVSAEELSVPVTAEVTLADGYTTEQVGAEVSSAVGALLASLPFAQGQTVPYSRFLACLLQCRGVADYSSLTVNGSSGALSVEAGEVPVLGAVTITATAVT